MKRPVFRKWGTAILCGLILAVFFQSVYATEYYWYFYGEGGGPFYTTPTIACEAFAARASTQSASPGAYCAGVIYQSDDYYYAGIANADGTGYVGKYLYRAITPCEEPQVWNDASQVCANPPPQCIEGQANNITINVSVFNAPSTMCISSCTNSVNTLLGCENRQTDVCDYENNPDDPACPLILHNSYCSYQYVTTGDECSDDTPDYADTEGDPVDHTTTGRDYDDTRTSEDYNPGDVVDNGDGSTTTTDTTQKETTEGGYTDIQDNGTTVVATRDNGTTTQETTTTTTTNNGDGSTEITNTKNTTTTDNGGTQTIIDPATGSTSTTDTPSSSESGTTTEVTVIGSDGSTTTTTHETGSDAADSSGTGDGEGEEFPEPPGITDEFDSLDDEIAAINNLEPNAPLTDAVDYDFSIGGGGTCTESLFTFQLHGFSMPLDLCPGINLIREALYWLFALLTAWFVFTTWASMYKGV